MWMFGNHLMSHTPGLLGLMEMAIEDDIPETEEAMIAQMAPHVDKSKCSLAEYGIEA